MPRSARFRQRSREENSKAARTRETDTVVTTVARDYGSARRDSVGDGSNLTVDHLLPADLPLGYHDFQKPTGAPVRLIVAPAVCICHGLSHVGLGDSAYAARICGADWGSAISRSSMARAVARGQGAESRDQSDLGWSPLIPQLPMPIFPTSRRFRSPLYLRIEKFPARAQLRDSRLTQKSPRAQTRSRRSNATRSSA